MDREMRNALTNSLPPLKGANEGVYVRLGSTSVDGSCNACTTSQDPTVYVIRLRGVTVRVCPSCRLDLLGLLK